MERHIRELKGFQRLTLNPGEQKTSEIHIPFKELKYYDETSRTWILEHTEYVFQAGPCADPAKLINVNCTL